MKGRPLSNPRHEAFCQYYVFGHPGAEEEVIENGKRADWRRKQTRNATRSYEAAGYSARGNTATAAAMRLLRREDILARIAEIDPEIE